MFTYHHISLSCLFELTGSDVTLPFDSQYTINLNGLYREQMWNKVGSGSNEMQSHIARVESKFEALKATLNPIFKYVLS